MSTILADRFLLPEFTGRNVVFRSGVTVNLSGGINFRATLDFGKQGSIDISHNAQGVLTNPLEIVKVQTKHVEDVLNLIDGLENYLRWVNKPTSVNFSQFCDSEDPLYVYGSRKHLTGPQNKSFPILEIFGRKLTGLDLRGSNIEVFVYAMIKCFRDHLIGVDGITVAQLIATRDAKAIALEKAKSRTRETAN